MPDMMCSRNSDIHMSFQITRMKQDSSNMSIMVYSCKEVKKCPLYSSQKHKRSNQVLDQSEVPEIPTRCYKKSSTIHKLTRTPFFGRKPKKKSITINITKEIKLRGEIANQIIIDFMTGSKRKPIRDKNGTGREKCETAVTVESVEDIPHWANHTRGHAPI